MKLEHRVYIYSKNRHIVIISAKVESCSGSSSSGGSSGSGGSSSGSGSSSSSGGSSSGSSGSSSSSRLEDMLLTPPNTAC